MSSAASPSVLTAMLMDAGIEVVHVPGLAVNRAREAPRRRAQERSARRRGDRRPGSPPSRPARGRAADRDRCRDPAARRPAPRAGRRPDAPRSAGCATCWPRSSPAWNASSTRRPKASLQLLGRYVTPAEIRHAGRRRLIEHILHAGRICRASTPNALADAGARRRRRANDHRPRRARRRRARPRARRRGRRHQRRLCGLDRDLRRRSNATLTRPSSAACPGWGPR